MRSWATLFGASLSLFLSAQQRVLHFTETSGYDHATREVSYAMFSSIAMLLDIEMDDDADGTSFNSPASLAQYSVIIFANTSGDAILDEQQRTNFEEWVANGGHVIGIHAASDTFRHSTANGSNTGTWDFYAELIGASVQQAPNHVDGTPLYAMDHVNEHEMTMLLPDPWEKNEEYYYWENGYYGPDNVELLRVEQTVGPNGQVNSYDAPRPMTWYRELPNGAKVFYTALGHATQNYTDDVLFRIHLQYALMWMIGIDFAGTQDRADALPLCIFPNPASSTLTISNAMIGSTIRIMDALGREALSLRVDRQLMTVDVTALPAASYMVRGDDRRRTPLMIVR